MSKVILQTETAYVYTKMARVRDDKGKVSMIWDAIVRGNPNKHATAMMKTHGPKAALSIVERLGNDSSFWKAVKQQISKAVKVLEDKR